MGTHAHLPVALDKIMLSFILSGGHLVWWNATIEEIHHVLNAGVVITTATVLYKFANEFVQEHRVLEFISSGNVPVIHDDRSNYNLTTCMKPDELHED